MPPWVTAKLRISCRRVCQNANFDAHAKVRQHASEWLKIPCNALRTPCPPAVCRRREGRRTARGAEQAESRQRADTDRGVTIGARGSIFKRLPHFGPSVFYKFAPYFHTQVTSPHATSRARRRDAAGRRRFLTLHFHHDTSFPPPPQPRPWRSTAGCRHPHGPGTQRSAATAVGLPP